VAAGHETRRPTKGVRYAAVAPLADGLIERQSNYNDIDEARAAASRLAQERG
jgi:hypothetical protein